MKSSAVAKQWTCRLCQVTQSGDKRRHVSQAHLKKAAYSCLACPYGVNPWYNRGHIIRHVKTKHPKKKVPLFALSAELG